MPSPSASVTTSKPDAPAAPENRRPTLLIVDDEEGPRQSLRVVFKEDYNLLLACDGPQALELARANPVHAAIIDIRMKGMSGIELLERLKALNPSVAVIMLTAYETIDTVRQALRHGACDYLNKPFDVATIRRAVNTAMERHCMAEANQSNNENLAALQFELQNYKSSEEIARTRGEIYASIIHDINGPLTIISGFVTLIDQRLGETARLEGAELEEVKHQLKSITYQVGNCIDISRRYLGFLRQSTDTSSPVQVNILLKELERLVESHPSKGLHQLVIERLPSDVYVDVVGTDLIQMLLNLTINALQCSTTPITVRIEGRAMDDASELSRVTDGPNDRVINREAVEKTQVLEISVIDNGPGIPPEVLPKAFHSHFTTKPVGKGTGLGLSIVHRLIKKARGAVHLHSKVGEGTVFKLYLPR